MNIAILKGGACIDAAVFDDIATAREFLALGIWPEAEDVAELPDGFGIGDSYDGEEWTKAPQPEPPEPPEPTPDYMAFVAGLLEGYANE